MKRKCSECPDSYFGSRSAFSDACDSCQNDSNTGWGGYTDHSIDNEDYSNEEDSDGENIKY